ncbi:hypothetical protein ES703_08826 [subsurface metagenome]
MAVTVKFFAEFSEATEKKQESIEGVNDVTSLLDELVRRFEKKLAERLYSSDTRELRKTVNILVNGRRLDFLQGLNTPLKDGDEVAIFPPVAGG